MGRMEYDDDYAEELRREAYLEKVARNNRSCSDGYCGADDCERCRPGCTRMAEVECEWCGEVFEPGSKDDRFCSEVCAKEHAADSEEE